MARGSIVERVAKDGRSTFYIRYRDAAGRAVKKAVGPSRREAERALARALDGANRGELRASRETFADYADRWLGDHGSRVEHSTFVDYSNTLRNHLRPAFGDLRLSAITPDHVRRYVAGKLDGTGPIREQPQGKGGRIKTVLSPKTINNQVGLLGLILGHAVADGLIVRNPADGRDRRRPLKVKVPHRERDYLRPGEVPVYLAGCSTFWHPRALTLLLTGCRVGELLALEWGDVDWHGNAVIIRRSVKRDGVGSTKGDETGRRIDMGPSLAAALKDHQARHAEHETGYDAGLVFPGPKGGYDDPGRVLEHEHRPALKRAGLRLSLVNHELRHTAAAAWLSLGLPMEYVRRQMGHKSITTTINNYGHLERTMIPAAAERAETALLGIRDHLVTTTPGSADASIRKAATSRRF